MSLHIGEVSQDPLQLFTQSMARECSGSVVECLTGDREFEPHQLHCVVVLEQDTFILA